MKLAPTLFGLVALAGCGAVQPIAPSAEDAARARSFVDDALAYRIGPAATEGGDAPTINVTTRELSVAPMTTLAQTLVGQGADSLACAHSVIAANADLSPRVESITCTTGDGVTLKGVVTIDGDHVRVSESGTGPGQTGQATYDLDFSGGAVNGTYNLVGTSHGVDYATHVDFADVALDDSGCPVRGTAWWLDEPGDRDGVRFGPFCGDTTQVF
jgi:hypothetical protein